MVLFLAVNFVAASPDFRRTHRQQGKPVGPCLSIYKDYCLQSSGANNLVLEKCSSKSSLFVENRAFISTGNRCILATPPRREMTMAIPTLTPASPACLKTLKFARNANFYLDNPIQGKLTAVIKYNDPTLPEHGFTLGLGVSKDIAKLDIYMCWQFR